MPCSNCLQHVVTYHSCASITSGLMRMRNFASKLLSFKYRRNYQGIPTSRLFFKLSTLKNSSNRLPAFVELTIFSSNLVVLDKSWPVICILSSYIICYHDWWWCMDDVLIYLYVWKTLSSLVHSYGKKYWQNKLPGMKRKIIPIKVITLLLFKIVPTLAI